MKIVADVGDDLLFGSRGETGNRNGFLVTLFLLQFPDEVADVEIIDTEIVTPRGETVRFINHETYHITGK